MLKRRLGCLAEDTEQMDAIVGKCQSHRHLVGAATSLPSEALELAAALSNPPRTQGETESCVGHATVRCADTRLRVQGVVAPYGSPLAAYTLGRELGRGKVHEALVDEGSYARLVLDAAKQFGNPREEAWPLWLEDGKQTPNVNRELPPDVLQGASAWKVVDYYVIDAGDRARAQAVAAANAKKYPVLGAVQVDDAFMRYDGTGLLQPCTGKSLGGHAVAIVGYRTRNGKREYLVANSWLDWGLPGSLAWASEEWVMSTFEAYAVTFEAGSGERRAPAGLARRGTLPSPAYEPTEDRSSVAEPGKGEEG